MHFNNKTHYAQVYILMEICATMTLQSCQLIGVAEGLTISYPNFFKLYISRGFILLSTLARIFAKLALMRNKNREVSAWSYNSSMVSNRAHAAHAIFNHSELAVRFVHVESRDQFRHMHLCTVCASIAWQI